MLQPCLPQWTMQGACARPASADAQRRGRRALRSAHQNHLAAGGAGGQSSLRRQRALGMRRLAQRGRQRLGWMRPHERAQHEWHPSDAGTHQTHALPRSQNSCCTAVLPTLSSAQHARQLDCSWLHVREACMRAPPMAAPRRARKRLQRHGIGDTIRNDVPGRPNVHVASVPLDSQGSWGCPSTHSPAWSVQSPHSR